MVHTVVSLAGRAADNVYHHGPLPTLDRRLDGVSQTEFQIGPCKEKAVLGILSYGASATRLKLAEL
jgi:hypothetical protein